MEFQKLADLKGPKSVLIGYLESIIRVYDY